MDLGLEPELDPNATWDDQGLWFALAFNSVVSAVLVSLSLFFLLSPILWLRRLYRPNHTKMASNVSSEATSTDTSRAAATASPSLCVGRALSYPCSLFTFLSWRSWMSVEEEVVHMEGFFPDAGSGPEDRSSGDGPERGGDMSSRITFGGSLRRDEERGDAAAGQTGVKNLPKTTPFDPQVAIYLAFLKMCATVFILGAVFYIWTSVLSGTDNYVERYMVKRDIHHCHRMDKNKTGCIDKAPFCRFFDDKNGTATECSPVSLHGLYDLSAENISPRSWRLWVVGAFDMCFCAFYIGALLFFLKRINAYIESVMRRQMEHALGHRVALVRGLREKTLTNTTFRKKYLEERTYCEPKTEKKGNEKAAAEEHDNSVAVDVDDHHRRRNGTLGHGDRVYHHCDCTGLGCVFSIVACNRYTLTRKDTSFTSKDCVQRVLFLRSSSFGMHTCIKKTESAMEALQEAVADQKANAQDGEPIMMCAPFPSCCSKVSKVAFQTERFTKQALRLNRYIDAASERPTSGSVIVVFSNALAAYEFVTFFECRHGLGPCNAAALIAGPPDGIIHFNLSLTKPLKWARTILFFFLFTLLLFFWSVPIGFVSSLDNLAHIPGVGKTLLSYYLKTPETLQKIITSFLPVIMLELFDMVLPIIIRYFVIFMGAVNQDEVGCGVLYLQYLFMLLTGVIFQAALQGGLTQLADLISDPSGEAITNFFVALVIPQGGYWYARVITSTCISAWLEFIGPWSLLAFFCRRRFVTVQRAYDDLFETGSFDWPQLYSCDLSILAMGLLFHMTAPLLALFVGFYFLVRYVTQRCQLYDRYRPKIHPLNDCTVFGAPAQAMRAMSWLYCLGGVGGVLFMGLRKHIGGVVLCSLSLVASMALLVYVHILTRRWVSSLDNARQFFGHQTDTQTPLGTTSRVNSANGPGNDSCGQDKRGPGASSSAQALSQEGNPMEPGYGGSRVQEKQEKRHGVGGDNVAGADNEDGDVGGDSVPCSCDQPEVWSGDEAGSNQVELVPQTAHTVGACYQPKHQRLSRINVPQVIREINETVFHVRRYWDFPFAFASEAEMMEGDGDDVQSAGKAEGRGKEDSMTIQGV